MLGAYNQNKNLPENEASIHHNSQPVGYVMDYFCIERVRHGPFVHMAARCLYLYDLFWYIDAFQSISCQGTLFDDPSVVTVAKPERHSNSIHCLVDVAPCLASPYEALYALPFEDTTGTNKHSRGRCLDNQLKDKILELAREVGRKAPSVWCAPLIPKQRAGV